MPLPLDNAKRDSILDAGLELFATLGYHGTAVPKVADKAGVAAGTIYRYFKDKEALVNTIFQKQKGEILNYVLEAYSPTQSWEKRFHLIFERILSFGLDKPNAFAFLELHHHQSYLDKQSRELEVMVISQIRSVFESAQQEGAVRKEDPNLLMHTIWGALVGLLKANTQDYIKLTPQSIQTTAQVCWSAIKS